LLVQFFIEDIKRDGLRDALEACSIVRRVSDSLLSAMLQIDNKSAVQLYGELEKMEFIESHDDGLSLHEMIRTVLSSSLKARSPLKYSCYRRNAGKTLLKEMKEVSCNQLWRYTADILYLVDNPVIRSAFFPQNDQRAYSVLPAQPADRQTVLSTVREHESAMVSDIYSMWWDRNPGSFHCVKDSENRMAGFYFLIKPEQVTEELRKYDPVIAEWMNDLALRDGGHIQADKNLFIRRWLSVADGESLSNVQAACWLDIKRTYLEMRPRLQRVYLTLNDLQPYASAATELGFQVLGKVIEIDKIKYYTAMLDMGPDSVDGWISTRLMNEIAQDSEHEERPDWFDAKARQLKLNQQHIDLTPLEFGTLDLLVKNRGTAITRKQLLKEVWGIEYEGSSNVVDTIVLSLRKKLQQKSTVIHSVRGTGYRFESEK